MSTTAPYLTPSNASLTANAREATEYANTHSPVESLTWFFDKVRDGGDWDYKGPNNDLRYEDFGNVNYGVAGRALGIPSIILDIGAGLQQYYGDKPEAGQGSPLTGPPWGDDIRDQDRIHEGEKFADDNGLSNPTIIPEQVLRDFLREVVLHPDRLLTELLKKYFEDALKFRYPRDPIILDLDDNGIKTVGLASNIHFDYDNDGVLTQTGWVGNGDALLVLDRNSNGNIDNGTELFGDYTPINRTNVDGATTTTYAPNGFAALASLDSNNDGIIDANDAAFADLKLWRDTNQDGTTNSGELITLSEAGIVSLNLANVLKNQATGNGNTLTREGSFTKQVTTLDSATGETVTQTVTQTMGEYNLAINTFDTQFKDDIAISDTAKTLPNIQGSGNVRELQQAANDAAWRVAA